MAKNQKFNKFNKSADAEIDILLPTSGMANSAGGPFIQTTMSATCDENFFDESFPSSGFQMCRLRLQLQTEE